MTTTERAENLSANLHELAERLESEEFIDGYDLLRLIQSLAKTADRIMADLA